MHVGWDLDGHRFDVTNIASMLSIFWWFCDTDAAISEENFRIFVCVSPLSEQDRAGT